MRLLVTYLEQLREPVVAEPSSIGRAEVGREFPARDDYLSLYRAVGAPVHWDLRLRLDPTELQQLLHSNSFVLFVLRVERRAVGLCEFEARPNNEYELVHFGVVPHVQGQGLGKFLLHRSLTVIWKMNPARVWLHTDTNDSSRAVPLYLQFGFRQFAQKFEELRD
ncbi:MAG: GNAT family N-acetyltransferase [Proteobacteria bacterium]|nr:GNAT family N-acetyltransferase [Pseudomonadota bacterium]